ncbi:MAG: C40 family peptidase [Bacteroidetes bacterium]|nr:C40 family peptidase [Bacteroidota bacterium]
MAKGICHLTLIPVRSEPSDRSEMVTQMLFGELDDIIEEQKDWVRVITDYDGYDGWIDRKQILELSDETYGDLKNSLHYLTLDLMHPISVACKKGTIPLVIGSSLPGLRNGTLLFGKREYGYDGNTKLFSETADRKMLTGYAMLYLNCPYLWGGRSPFGIDCSGLTQMIYKLGGRKLKRDAHQQAMEGTIVSFISEAQPGDLAFFDDESDNIIHVGMILGDGKIIHSSGHVRIDTIDHQGIYNIHQKCYTHRLRVIKNLLPS